MPGVDSSSKQQKGQAIILFTLMVASVLVPMVGLAIDGTRAYIIKAKLSTAVDGGAIAAARLLASGASSQSQVDNAVATAKTFVAANFPTGFFGASLLPNQPEVCVDLGNGSDPCNLGSGGQVDTYKKRIVVIKARATVPTLFMRIAGFNNSTVAASGRASRRDVRVVLVIDRSSSMGSFIGDVKTQAQNFVGKFAPLRDEVGLVVFGGSAILAYPARNIATMDPTNPSTIPPPNVNFSPTVGTLIGQIAAGSHTGTAEALYLAYMSLKADAATNTDLANKLNVIVVFTDGLPNGVTVTANGGGAGQSLKPSGPSPNKSPCTYRNAYPGTPMTGWMGEAGGFKYGVKKDGTTGLYPTMMTKAGSGKTGRGDDIGVWMQRPGDDDEGTALPIMDKCGSTNHGDQLSYDLLTIPTQDIYGNKTNFNPIGVSPPLYQQGSMYSTFGPGALALGEVNQNYQIGLASWNATAHQAWKIWNNKIYNKTSNLDVDDPNPINPVIFTIGYDHQDTSGEKPDLTLLKIIANTSDSPVAISNKMHGKAYLATSADAVAQAFAEIASEILRLAQ